MTNLPIPYNELLWRTRGRHWEYCFLMLPDIDRGSWWRFYREVRAELTISPDGDELLGTIIDREGRRHPYLASIFLDSNLVDAAGRETEQFVVWFPQNLSETNLPCNLAQTVSEHFATAINSPEISSLSDADEASPDTVFRALFPREDAIKTIAKNPGAPATRTLEINHQTDADLTTTRPPKKRGSITLIIAIIGGLLAGLWALHSTSVIQLPFIGK